MRQDDDTTNTPLRLAVFDVDGTLVDSQGAIVSAMRQASGDVGISPPDGRDVRRIIGLLLIEGIGRIFPAESAVAHDAICDRYKASIIAMRQNGTIDEPLFPGAVAAIDALTATGWLLGIATGKPRRGLVNTLKPHGLLDRFLTLQTADRARGKPNPDMLFQAMAETGAEPARTVMIGDTTFDMEMARHAGAYAIGVAWGYHEQQELQDAGANQIIASFAALAGAAAALMEE